MLKKKFFLIESLVHPAGTERIACELVNSLSKEGMDVGFIVLSASIESYYPVSTGVPIYSINTPFSKRLQAILNLRRLLKKECPDFVVNVGVPMGQISIPASWGLATKVVGWEHFNLYAGSKWGYYWRLMAAKLSYKTVVLTRKDRSDYLAKVDANVVTIPNFLNRFTDIYSELDSKIVLSVGRLTAQKGYDLLLPAWASVVKQMPDWKLYIVGSGCDEKQLKLQAQQLSVSDSVVFIPATGNVEQYYKTASLYVMSSRFEGMPMVLLEAKMCGLPCVSFNCPNGPEEIIRHSVDGLVVELSDTEDLTEGILSLISDRNRLKEFGKKAKEDALSKYTWNAVRDEWVNLFSSKTC